MDLDTDTLLTAVMKELLITDKILNVILGSGIAFNNEFYGRNKFYLARPCIICLDLTVAKENLLIFI
jgi:hypothetical protein